MSQPWPHPQFAHPAFATLRAWLEGFAAFPDHSSWARIPDRPRAQSGAIIQFVDPDSLTRYYEAEIHELGRVATRLDDWHDCFNAMIWLTFSRTKAALNALHYRHLPQGGKGQRGPIRDAATLFDECGLIVPYCDAALLDALRGHDWHQLFVQRRADWGQTIEAVCFGHANYEALLEPFTGLTGKCWPVPVSAEYFRWPQAQKLAWLDDYLAAQINADQLQTPRQLPPLPYLGVPGWWPEQDASFYANTKYFRPLRQPVHHQAFNE
ncbi:MULTISPECIES: DUF3025 domain-containing protein [Silvimonas]|uniref:DUF3025 domain-containing protein n=1 Tax=Silvimonas TaxID=300264 RepID=UPI0024B36806|nr:MULTISPECIES: DUF3025 domain-containing protein [Silvimonas]MDR3426302.1 DUF3025 domain-containing protein [Silvimonas sp.]